MKFLPTVEEIADISPMCSIIVASAIGATVMMQVASSAPSQLPKSENVVSFHWKGRPSQAASCTGVKSTCFVSAATR